MAIVAVLGFASAEVTEFYKLEIIAKTGDSVVGATDPLGPIAAESVSINDDGEVAFVGQFGTSSFLGNGVIVGNGTSDPLSDLGLWSSLGDEVGGGGSCPGST